MKVLIVDHSGHLGGGQLSILRYLEQPAPFDRELLVLEDGELVRRARALGIAVTVLGEAASHLAKVAVAPRVRRVVRDIAPDVVLANSLTAANIVGLRPWRGAVNLAYLRETLSLDSVPAGPKRLLMMRCTFAGFDGFIANSASTGRSVPSELRRIPVATALPVSGVAEVVRGRMIGGSERFRVLSLSRLEEWKGVHVVVDAFEELGRRGVLGGFELRIAGDATLGDSAYLDRVAAKAASLGDSTRLLGRLDDVRAALDDVDALVIPTLRAEPFGQVMAQAASRGRLIISSAGGGPTEILGPTSAALFVAPGDSSALADALVFARTSPAESGAIARRGAAAARALLDDSTSNGLSEAIRSLYQRARGLR